MPKVLTGADRELKRHLILEAAAHEIARYGYDRANINTIAERAGIGRGTIYLYFASKDEVLATLLDTIGAMIDDAVATCLAQNMAWEAKMGALVQAFARLAQEHPDFFRVHVSALHGVNRDIGQPVAHWLQRSVIRLAGALAEAAATEAIQAYDAPTLAMTLLGILESLALLPQVLDWDDAQRQLREDTLTHFIWHGMAPLPARS